MRKFAALAAIALASCRVASPPPAITIENGWARVSLPGEGSSVAYFTIRNSGGEDRLVSVSAPDAEASLHSTSMDQGVM